MSEQKLAPINMDQEGNPTDGRGEWKKFLCRACGWIYDERYGDEDSGLPAGTRYEDIPEDWFCPVCGVTKRDFEPYQMREVVPFTTPQPMSDSQKSIIIVGAGMAGWAMVEALRTQDAQIPIILISADDAHRYFKPTLSIAISQKKTLENGLITETAEQARQRLNIHLLANTFVMNVNADTKQVRTTRGDFYYEKLILAIGAKPALPNILPASEVWRINSLNLFVGLQEKLAAKPKQKIALIGAGMIGVELAEDLSKAGHDVVLLDRLALPLAEILPDTASDWILQGLQQVGVTFIGNVDVQKIDKVDEQYRIEYKENHQQQSVVVDLIIANTGLMIDERLPQRLGIDYHLRMGIWVDELTLQTSKSDIYALGDCIAMRGQPYRFVAPLHQQAQVIASQILGECHLTYQHQSPIIRLKTKQVSVKITGDLFQHKTLAWHIIRAYDNELCYVKYDAEQNIVVKAELMQFMLN